MRCLLALLASAKLKWVLFLLQRNMPAFRIPATMEEAALKLLRDLSVSVLQAGQHQHAPLVSPLEFLAYGSFKSHSAEPLKHHADLSGL